MIICEMLLGAVISAIFSIALTLYIEYIRKPRLEILLSDSEIQRYEEGTRPARKAKFLDLVVYNPPLQNKWFKWLTRNAALQCHGTINFCDLNGNDIFGKAMIIRWKMLPNPTAATDTNKYDHAARIDIFPGIEGKEPINIATRFDDDEVCFGWTNKNFYSDPQWRNPEWKIPKGQFLVKINISFVGGKCTGKFKLINDGDLETFKIEKG